MIVTGHGPDITYTGEEIAITHRRGTDLVMSLDFAPLSLADATVAVLFTGATQLPTATVGKTGSVATVFVSKASVANVHTCRYLVTYADHDGITTPCIAGVFRVID